MDSTWLEDTKKMTGEHGGALAEEYLHCKLPPNYIFIKAEKNSCSLRYVMYQNK
jgi:hypothetical protein